MNDSKIKRAINARIVAKIKREVLKSYDITELSLNVDRRIAIDPKRTLVWCLYFYTNRTVKEIGDIIHRGHCNTLYLVKSCNRLISTDHKVASNVMQIEKELVKLGFEKKNRVHHHKNVSAELNYAESYKRESERPIIHKLARKINLAEIDRKIATESLRVKRINIGRTKDLDEVIRLAKEIKELEQIIA